MKKLSEYSTEELKDDIQRRENEELEEALIETLYQYGFFGSHKQLAKSISKGINNKELRLLIVQLRFEKTKQCRDIGTPEFVELDQYTQLIESSEED